MNGLESYWRRLGYSVTDQDIVGIEEARLDAGRFRAGRNWMKIPFCQRWMVTLDFPGVYVFVSESHDVLYVGSSNNLSQRLRHYEGLTFGEGKQARQGNVVYVRKNKRRNEHLTLELNLIQRLRPKHNRRLT